MLYAPTSDGPRKMDAKMNYVVRFIASTIILTVVSYGLKRDLHGLSLLGSFVAAMVFSAAGVAILAIMEKRQANK